MDLSVYREQIDKIDGDLLRLFEERMSVSRQVALFKKEHDLPVLNAEREREVLGVVGDKASAEIKPYALELYTTILEISRAYQEKIIT